MRPIDSYESALAELIRLAFGDLEKYLRGLVMDLRATNGVIDRDALNITRIDSAIRGLSDRLDAAGMGKVREEQRGRLGDLMDDLLGMFDRAGAVAADGQISFSEVSQSAIDLLIDGADKSIASVSPAVSDKVATYLRQAVIGGGDKAKLMDDIASVVKSGESQAKTIMSTSLHAFNRTITQMHGQDLGVEWYAYQGPDDDLTREWCSHWVGCRGTTSEVEATIDQWGHDKQPGPAMVWGGGWNCRHGWMPIIDPEDLKRYPEGPR